MIQTAKFDLFARIPVAHYTAALKWYERLPGSVPAFFPNDTEAVWELGEHRYLYVVRQPEHAGHAKHLLFVGDLRARRADRRSGNWPRAAGYLFEQRSHTCPEAVPKGDHIPRCRGNEIGFGGAPL